MEWRIRSARLLKSHILYSPLVKDCDGGDCVCEWDKEQTRMSKCENEKHNIEMFVVKCQNSVINAIDI